MFRSGRGRKRKRERETVRESERGGEGREVGDIEGSKGSGLGLYIVKETVDKLQGKIDVVSKLNQGTTFTIELPELKMTDKN